MPGTRDFRFPPHRFSSDLQRGDDAGPKSESRHPETQYKRAAETITTAVMAVKTITCQPKRLQTGQAPPKETRLRAANDHAAIDRLWCGWFDDAFDEAAKREARASGGHLRTFRYSLSLCRGRLGGNDTWYGPPVGAAASAVAADGCRGRSSFQR